MIGLGSTVLRHLEDNSEAPLLSMDLTPIFHLPTQGLRQDSCLGLCSLPSHLRSHIIEAILPHLVLTVPHHPDSRISSRLPLLLSPRTGRHICLPGPLGRCLLELEEVVGGETIDKPPVHPMAVEG